MTSQVTVQFVKNLLIAFFSFLSTIISYFLIQLGHNQTRSPCKKRMRRGRNRARKTRVLVPTDCGRQHQTFVRSLSMENIFSSMERTNRQSTRSRHSPYQGACRQHRSRTPPRSRSPTRSKSPPLSGIYYSD